MSEQFTFKGLDDWFEVFEAGPQTDSQGRTRTWTVEELDQMVANHRAAPFVCGHPKHDAPAYGWSAALKRVGNKLLTKGKQIHAAFEKGVQEGRYPERSVSITKDDSGFRIRHVGFLGAVPPAVEGLAPVQFSADADAYTYDFSFREARKLGLLQRLVRGIRDAWIDEHGIDKANAAVPEHLIDEVGRMETDERVSALSATDPLHHQEPGATAQVSSPASHSQHQSTDPEAPVPDNKTFSQADIDAAVAAERQKHEAKNRQLEFSARCAHFKGLVDDLMTDEDGDARLLPAQAEGLAEFMARLEQVEDASFEFSVGEGAKAKTVKVELAEFMEEFLGKLGKQLSLNKTIAATDPKKRSAPSASFAGQPVDQERAQLDQAARDYMAEHPGTDYVQAVSIVQSQQ